MTSINSDVATVELQQELASVDLQVQTLDLFFAYEVCFKGKSIAQIVNTADTVWTIFVGDNPLHNGNYDDCLAHLKSRCNQYLQAGIKDIPFEDATEIYLQEMPVAAILYEDIDFCTQPYVVKVKSEELHRADTWAKCYRYVQNQYQNGKFLASFLIYSA